MTAPLTRADIIAIRDLNEAMGDLYDPTTADLATTALGLMDERQSEYAQRMELGRQHIALQQRIYTAEARANDAEDLVNGLQEQVIAAEARIKELERLVEVVRVWDRAPQATEGALSEALAALDAEGEK